MRPSTVAIALLWQMIYRAGSLGLGRPDWLSNPRTALPALMLISIWAHVGGQMLVFLTGLQQIPRAYLEAARVDGAGAWRGFWRVTLPLLRPVTGFVLLTGGARRFPDVHPGLCAHAGWAGTGDRRAGASDLSDRICFAGVGDGMRAGAAALGVLLIFRWPQLRLLRKGSAHA